MYRRCIALRYWEFVTASCIRHRDGHEIRLLKGTWQYPVDVAEEYNGDLTADETFKLLCEALEFAESIYLTWGRLNE